MLSVASNSDEDDAVATRSDFGPVGATLGTDHKRGLQVHGRVRTGTVEGKASPAGGPTPMRGVEASPNLEDNGPEGIAPHSEPEPIGSPSLAGALA